MIEVMILFPAADITSIEIKILHCEKIGLDEIQDRKLYQIKGKITGLD